MAGLPDDVRRLARIAGVMANYGYDRDRATAFVIAHQHEKAAFADLDAVAVAVWDAAHQGSEV